MHTLFISPATLGCSVLSLYKSLVYSFVLEKYPCLVNRKAFRPGYLQSLALQLILCTPGLVAVRLHLSCHVFISMLCKKWAECGTWRLRSPILLLPVFFWKRPVFFWNLFWRKLHGLFYLLPFKRNKAADSDPIVKAHSPTKQPFGSACTESFCHLPIYLCLQQFLTFSQSVSWQFFSNLFLSLLRALHSFDSTYYCLKWRLIDWFS